MRSLPGRIPTLIALCTIGAVGGTIGVFWLHSGSFWPANTTLAFVRSVLVGLILSGGVLLYHRTRYPLQGWRFGGGGGTGTPTYHWTDGFQTVRVEYVTAGGFHAGWRVSVTLRGVRGSVQLGNRSTYRLHDALVVADLFMRDDAAKPDLFSETISPEVPLGAQGSAEQDHWLATHAPNYTFRVIDPTAVDRYEQTPRPSLDVHNHH